MISTSNIERRTSNAEQFHPVVAEGRDNGMGAKTGVKSRSQNKALSRSLKQVAALDDLIL